MSTPAEEAAHERGRLDGEVAARLSACELRLDTVNGSIRDSAKATNDLTLAVQKLDIEAVTREITKVATAAALETARKIRQESVEHAWSPVQKLLAIVIAVTAIGGFVLMLLTYNALHAVHP